MTTPTPHTGDAFWVFGYGSLMWNPGFTALAAEPAVLAGYHRSFCIYSTHYRGTPERPGLVLGLAPGGECPGVAFRVAGEQAPLVRDYLRERELCGYAYVEATLPVRLRDGQAVTAYTFVADPAHRQYAGDLGVEASAAIIMEAVGRNGLNRDYLINTVRELEAHGVVEPPLHALLEEVWRRTGEVEAGQGI
ncbi:gamma-glutamylcyclotransferase [Caenispirillum bisanense]|uniref:gamma-glutamylcyclotransferase n=1 Tax=Caenispirillum bisanense TaxID=414052 RepID=UPI0031D3186D